MLLKSLVFRSAMFQQMRIQPMFVLDRIYAITEIKNCTCHGFKSWGRVRKLKVYVPLGRGFYQKCTKVYESVKVGGGQIAF